MSLNNETLIILGMYISSSQFENKAFISAQLATQFESMIKVFKISYQGKKKEERVKDLSILSSSNLQIIIEILAKCSLLA